MGAFPKISSWQVILKTANLIKTRLSNHQRGGVWEGMATKAGVDQTRPLAMTKVKILV